MLRLSKRRNCLSCVAAALLAAAIMPHAGAQAPVPLPPAAGVNGWIMMKSEEGGYEETDWWNTQTGEWAAHVADNDIVNRAEYKNPQTGQNAEYRAVGGRGKPPELGWVMLSELYPLEADALRKSGGAPLIFSTLLAELKAKFGDEGVNVIETDEAGMKRYTLEKTAAAKKEIISAEESAQVTSRGHFRLSLPSSVLVDPRTQLVQQVTAGKTRGVIKYGVAPITSIYDVGVPRNAKVLDGRPGKDVVEVFDRVRTRIAKPLPAGVVAIVTKTQINNRQAADRLKVVELAGQNWGYRRYKLAQEGAAGGEKLPDDWAAAGGDTLFRTLGTVVPNHVFRSDGAVAFDADIDPASGQEMHPSNIFGAGAPKSLPGPIKRIGPAARVEEAGPTNDLYLVDTEIGRYVPGNTLDRITSPDRPGLVGIWVRTYDDFGGRFGLSMDKTYWIDPQHDDRPVIYTRTSYNPATHEVIHKETTEFSDYATLPAPDGRSYPTQWTRIGTNFDKEGKASESLRETAIFRFFPGKALPAIPKNPVDLP